MRNVETAIRATSAHEAHSGKARHLALRLSVALVLALGTLAPSAADACEEFWYLRNLIADRAGYCFTTPLGRALFDNSDCTTSELRLSPDDMARVEAIRQREIEHSCAVDTSATSLPDLPPFDWHLIETIPVPTGYESGCIGYKLSPFALLSAPRAGAAVVGEVRPGDSIGFNYEDEGGWMFLITDAPTGYMGWAPADAMPLDGSDGTCAGWAG